MSQHYCVLILLHSILASTSALQRECSGYRPNKCTSPILCNEDEDCVITCNKLGCESSEIYCPLHGNCTIICQGLHSCTGATIYANSSIGNFDLICQANYANSNGNACRNIKVFGNTLPSSSSNTTTDHFNIICETCPTAEIHCAHSTDCQITCNGTMDSCQQMQIIGPLSNELYIQCEGTNACRNAIVSAYDTSDLFIDGCSDPYSNSCANLTVYCPSATNTKHCHLEGDNNLAMVQLYAVDGWNDIDIDYFGQYPHASGTMHCGSDYTISCDISSDSWSCADTSLCATNPTVSPIDTTPLSTLSTAYTETLTLTNEPKARDGLVKEETTTIGSINTQYIVLVQHNDQQRLVTLLTIICGVLAYAATVDNLLQSVYKDAGFEFEIEVKLQQAQICDIFIGINKGKLQTYSANDQKIRSYIMKSSDVVQSINGIFKTLQARYIIICDQKSKYLTCKKAICQNLIKSGWNHHDIRNATHLRYESRSNLLDKFIENRTIKRMNYFHTKSVQITMKNWFKIPNYRYKQNKKEKKEIKREITDVIKYNKNYTQAHRLKRIVNDNFRQFKIKYNIYFKYNKAFSKYL
eukprot:818034_1